jgi:hypothetical protein
MPHAQDCKRISATSLSNESGGMDPWASLRTAAGLPATHAVGQPSRTNIIAAGLASQRREGPQAQRAQALSPNVTTVSVSVPNVGTLTLTGGGDGPVVYTYSLDNGLQSSLEL